MFIQRSSRVLRHIVSRSLSTRASGVLSALDIPISGEIPGVYDGQWKGSGDVFQSVCPTSGEVLAHVRSASPTELHETLEKTREAYTQFRSMWCKCWHVLYLTYALRYTCSCARRNTPTDSRTARCKGVCSMPFAKGLVRIHPQLTNLQSEMHWALLSPWKWEKFAQRALVKCKSSLTL